jgi:hypothetical protein
MPILSLPFAARNRHAARRWSVLRVLATNVVPSLETCFAVAAGADERSIMTMASTKGRPVFRLQAIIIVNIVGGTIESTSYSDPTVDLLLACFDRTGSGSPWSPCDSDLMRHVYTMEDNENELRVATYTVHRSGHLNFAC